MNEELKDIFNNVKDWLRFAEAKNAGALTFSSALIFTSLRLMDPGNAEVINILYCVLALVGVIGVILAFVSFAPVLNKYYKKEITGTSEHDNVYYFMDLKDYKDFKEQKDHRTLVKLIYKKAGVTYIENALEEDLALQIIVNSQIAFRKYELFKLILKVYFWGVLIGLVGVLLLKFIGI